MNKGKQQQFLNLYKPVHARFERFCRARACGDMPYEDLINETLLVAYKRFDEIKKEKSFLSFLIGISLRVLSNSKRKKKAELSNNEQLFAEYSDPNRTIESRDDVALLHQALARLPEKQREAIILFEITGFSIKEIMNIQKSGASAVKQRLMRARKELARIIKEELTLKTDVRYE